MSNDIGLLESNVLAITKNNTIDKLFLELYEQEHEEFLKLIKTFCIKDDNEIKKYILNISDKLDLLSNKKEYLYKYLDVFFDDNKIDEDIESYFKLICSKFDVIKAKIEEAVLETTEITNDFLYSKSDFNCIIKYFKYNFINYYPPFTSIFLICLFIILLPIQVINTSQTT